ncbi:MAG TPA: PEGA domain-containing protein [Ignavibacteriaceae bacterium]|nr:PEGA domain-containing protein [Ignavibacteriaceae bacterium]
MKSGIRIYIKSLLIEVMIFLLFTFGSCEKDVTTTPPPEPVPQASLFINSIPPGSIIFVNGRNTGRITPDSLPYIEEGSYQITLKKKYFRDTSFVMSAVEGERTGITINYLSNPLMLGSLSLRSVPNSSLIFVNDSSINEVTPFVLEHLIPGEYMITLKKENYRDVVFTATVESNKLSSAIYILQDTSVWVDYKTTNSGIQSDFLTAVVLDMNGIKWIGTTDAGLIKYDGNSFINYNTDNSNVPHNTINSITLDNRDRVWVCTNNGIGILDGNVWTNYNTSDSPLKTNEINIVRFDQSGTAWIGTQINFAKFDGLTWRNYDYSSGTTAYLSITDIAISNSSTIWLAASNSGLVKFDGENSYTVYKAGSYNILNNSVTSLGIEQNGNLWILNKAGIGNRGGVTLLQGEEFSAYPFGENYFLPRSIFIDNNDKKWIATNEGILTITGTGEFNLMNADNSGLTSTNLFQIAGETDGTIWIASYGGGLIKYKGER